MKYTLIFLILTSFIGAATAKAPNEEIVIKTTAQCMDCKENIEKEFTYTKGIKSFEIDFETGDLTVVYNSDKTDPDKIRRAISRAGYDADDVPANSKAYNKLDECCKAHKD